MRLRCRYCLSQDLWQPRRKTFLDTFIEAFGFSRLDCRNCHKRTIRRVAAVRADGEPERSLARQSETDPE